MPDADGGERGLLPPCRITPQQLRQAAPEVCCYTKHEIMPTRSVAWPAAAAAQQGQFQQILSARPRALLLRFQRRARPGSFKLRVVSSGIRGQVTLSRPMSASASRPDVQCLAPPASLRMLGRGLDYKGLAQLRQPPGPLASRQTLHACAPTSVVQHAAAPQHAWRPLRASQHSTSQHADRLSNNRQMQKQPPCSWHLGT